MVEITYLALLNRLRNWGRAPVIVTRALAADISTLLGLLREPAAQQRLVAGISPLLRPRAEVEASRSERLVSVRVTLRGRDALWITWILTPRRGTTEVDLAAQLEGYSLLARLALVLGGRRWLQRHLEQTLGTLSTLAHRVAEDLDGAERQTAVVPRLRVPREHRRIVHRS
jgi:hypothetical protein